MTGRIRGIDMNEAEKNVVRSILAKVREGKRIAAARIRHQREDDDVAKGQIAILMDDLRAEGINPASAVGMAIATAIMRLRSIQTQRDQPIDPNCEIDKNWPNG